MSEPRIAIYDIMACNVYMDFENSLLQKEQHKFLVAFYPTGGAAIPELVESITATGPDGYRVEVLNQEFNAANRNGWIFDRTTNSHWYMVNLDTGFMKEGEYKIEVKGKNGSVCSKSRNQLDAPGQALVSAYLENRSRVYESFAPGKARPFAKDGARRDVPVNWSSLKAVAGQDGYYIYRLSEGRSGKEFDTQRLVWWDNIFTQRVTDPEAGRNRDHVVLATELKPNQPYVYFVEITDSNAMGETNICIFQPHQTFTT